LSFWSLIGNTLQKKKGTFGQTKEMTTLFSLAFSKKTEFYYTGTINGQIYIWKNNQTQYLGVSVARGLANNTYAMGGSWSVLYLVAHLIQLLSEFNMIKHLE
jgi:hypothetical protein